MGGARTRIHQTIEAILRTAEEHRYLFQAMLEARGVSGRAPDGVDARVLASLLMEFNDRLLERFITGGRLTRQQLAEGAEAMWMGTIYGTTNETATAQ